MRDPLRLPEPQSKIRYRRVIQNRAEILSQLALTHDTYELRVRCVAGSELLDARAGQFATLHFPTISAPRPYSFARDPAAEPVGEYTFFIRLVPDGEVSQWLADEDRSGTEIEIAGPLGEFGLDDVDTMMLCVAGGSGMSAVMAIIEQACARQLTRDCVFLYGARTQADLYCDRAIEDIVSRWHPNHSFEFVQVLSEESTGSSWTGARGTVTDFLKEVWIETDHLDPENTSAFFCGPPPMIEAGAEILNLAGVPGTRVYRDVFEDARSPAPVIDNRRCVLCDECLLVKPVENCIVETSQLTITNDGAVAGFRKVAPAHSSGLYYNTLFIDEAACIRCYACVSACPHDAISPLNGIGRTLRQQIS